jgi:hypothetical protein
MYRCNLVAKSLTTATTAIPDRHGRGRNPGFLSPAEAGFRISLRVIHKSWSSRLLMDSPVKTLAPAWINGLCACERSIFHQVYTLAGVEPTFGSFDACSAGAARVQIGMAVAGFQISLRESGMTAMDVSGMTEINANNRRHSRSA